MKSIMVVVANGSKARIFTTYSAHYPLVEIASLVAPEMRMHEQNMVSDLPGKNRSNSAGHAYEDEVNPKKYEMVRFARSLSEYLDGAREKDQIARLLIVASPALLGELRKHITDKTSDLIVYQLAKDLTTFDTDEIRKHLPKYLSRAA